MSEGDDVDEFIFPDILEEDLDLNNNAVGESPKGDVLGPASPSPDVVPWRLIEVDINIPRPLYGFLPKPCRYTRYYLNQDPRFSKN